MASNQTTKRNSKNQAPKNATPKGPPNYGGTKDDADLGANGRRLLAYLSEEKGASKAAEILTQARTRTANGKGVRMNDETGNFVSSGKGDRFIRWETLCVVAGIKPAEGRKIIRRLGRQPGAREAGMRSAA